MAFATTLVASCALVFAACATDPMVIGWDCDAGFCREEPPPSFATPDAGEDSSSYELVNYCPSSECPPGYTTCPDSRYPCDVDLRNDMDNCGACGSKCPMNAQDIIYACVEGRCEYTCDPVSGKLDCDGVPDNGCETRMMTEGNCSACGEVCPADLPCAMQGPLGPTACGCTDGRMPCPGGPTGNELICTDVEDDDSNCGGCGIACDPTDGGKTPPPNTYYGCRDRQCGKLKCKGGFGDCDLDPENGCETTLGTDENCLVCGDACGAGQKCALDFRQVPFCACPTGLTFCGECIGSLCVGECKDTTSDPNNCGGCNVRCLGGSGGDDTYTMLAACEFGSCTTVCTTGRADCNGAISDGCEVETSSDPDNCGACGKKCDAAIGQACVNGKCVVEPCDMPDDAGVAR